MAILGNYDTEINQRVLTPNIVNVVNHMLHGSIEGLVKVVVMKTKLEIVYTYIIGT